ncbi:aspartate aminotransferase family protein [Micromonospora cathayae]|uniref:Aspartate aminotransferase family protein n=1 Tax=Micromonospora cathayae TaxID=3028804 RepID=A0ABY7ZI43_9ACTN|nr:aspartate aminotransferase family protein [Micromonospora sp. HUAS 3]WDZ82657.1 aspartate aminotransferase family protein [Micromonospora sp. HUAS 3]
MMNGKPVRQRSAALYERAGRVLAGGVSSDARRGPGVPLYVDRAAGARLWDVDGTEYVDYVLAQGPMLLGHSAPAVVDAVAAQLGRGQAYAAQHPLEVEAAELVCRLVPGADLVRFNTVGSEAVIGAWRIARGATGRQKILKFEGHYHGWLDAALWSLHPAVDAAGPVDSPVPVPGTGGQQRSSAGDLVIAPWNDAETLTALMAAHGTEIAAIVMEPVLCNTGCIAPVPGFLDTVRELCRSYGCLLIFDEVITGFRLAAGGAQEYLGVTPDLAVYGKAIAGGLPVAAIAGRREVMDVVTRGEVGHAGTFNSNPLGMAAAVGNLTAIERDRDTIYPHLYRLGGRLMAGIREAAAQAGVPMLVDGPGPVFQTYLTPAAAVRDYRDFAATDRAGMGVLHRELLARGVNVVPRGLWFLSAAHTDDDVDRTLEVVADALRALRGQVAV